MAMDPALRCVLQNIFRGEALSGNLTSELLLEFFDDLGALLESGDVIGQDARLVRKVTDAKPGQYYVSGLRRPSTPTDCSRFIPLDDVPLYCDYDGSLALLFRGTAVTQDLANGLRAEHLSFDPNWRRPWWVVPTDDVVGLNAGGIRDLIGLSHYSSGSFAEIRFPVSYRFPDDGLAAPSFLDAGGDHLVFRPFVPSPDQPDDGWGRTLRLPTYADGAREAVHSAPADGLDHGAGLRVTDPIESPAPATQAWDDLYTTSEDLWQ